MLACLHQWVQEHGYVPSSATDWKRGAYGRPSAHACIVRFGSWSTFIRTAGYEPRRGGGASFCDKIVEGRRVYWTKDTVAEWFLDYLLAYGEWPQSGSSRKATEARRPSYTTVIRLFGSWVEAKRYAGWEGGCLHCGAPVWRSFQKFCSDRCKYYGPAVAEIVSAERACSGCGGELGSVTLGCKQCGERHRKKKRRKDPAFRAADNARRTKARQATREEIAA